MDSNDGNLIELSGSNASLSPTAKRARANLVSATLESLMTEGADGCSVRRIADRAGVSMGVINYHYPSIQNLVAEAYSELALSLLHAAADASAPFADDPRLQISRFIEHIFGPHVMDRRVLRAWIVFWGMIETSTPVRLAHEESSHASWTYLQSIFQRLHEQRPVRPSPRLAAIGLSAMMDGLWLELCLQPDNFTPVEAIRLCETWIDAIW